MRMVLAGLAAAMVAAGAWAQDRVPVWSGWAEEGWGGAADCTECFEAEYVLLGCARGDAQVRAELIGLVPPHGAGDRIAILIDVDGAAEERPAAVEFSEMLGELPVLTLRLGDPLFERLRGGRVLTLAMEGDRVEIPLTGAGQALDVMFAACR